MTNKWSILFCLKKNKNKANKGKSIILNATSACRCHAIIMYTQKMDIYGLHLTVLFHLLVFL